MASDKQRRKAVKHAKKSSSPTTGPHRHPDGDRRHRPSGGDPYREAMKAKELLQKIGLPPEEPEEESTQSTER